MAFSLSLLHIRKSSRCPTEAACFLSDYFKSPIAARRSEFRDTKCALTMFIHGGAFTIFILENMPAWSNVFNCESLCLTQDLKK